MQKRKRGRPTILETHGISPAYIYDLYLELGTFERVAQKLGITKRTVGNHLRRAGYYIQRGKPKDDQERWRRMYDAVTGYLSSHELIPTSFGVIPTKAIARWHVRPAKKEGYAEIHITLQGGRTATVVAKVSPRRAESSTTA